MLKKLIGFFLTLVLCAGLLTVCAAEQPEAYWGSGYGPEYAYGSGTLAQALAAAAADETVSYVTLNKDVVNADYLISGGDFILDLDGYNISAAPGKAAFTVRNAAYVEIQGYDSTVFSDTACFVVEGGGAFLSNNLYLAAANGKPAIVMKKGIFQLDNRVYFMNDAASCHVEYQGGQMHLNTTGMVRVANASDHEVALNDIYAENSILTHEKAKLYQNGQMKTTFMKGQTYEIGYYIQVSFDSNGGTGSMPTEMVWFGNYKLPECTFEGPEGKVCSAWEAELENGDSFTVSLGEVIFLECDAVFKPIWVAPVKLNDMELKNGQYMDNAGNVSAVKPAAGYAYYEDGVLTLNNFVGESIEIDTLDMILELAGNNKLTYTDPLEVNSANLTIQGEGSLMIEGTDDTDGIDMEDGDLIIRGGNIIIEAEDHGIEIDKSDDVEAGIGQFFMFGGTLDITAGDEGIDAEEGVTINGGTIIIKANDQGIDSSESMTINGGTLNVIAIENNAIEVSDYLHINGGDLTLQTLNAEAWAVIAYEGLTVRTLPEGYRVAFVEDEDNDGEVGWTIVNEMGKPVVFFKHVILVPVAVPATGDNTPVALLMTLVLMSLCGMAYSRRRSA